MEVLVGARPLRRFSNIGSRRLLRAIDGGGRSVPILDAVDPAFVGLFGDQVETELLANDTSEKAPHRMLLPTCGGHDRSDRRPRRRP
jgi:hypothetical protein